ncbi:hypothetical protein F441_06801 [Phytophthora nicotianae CJ01A1]|uniref:Uncharacterized protein n=4 Tax=Phytophthora nicotianae TaxID=4792 RepID=V9FFU3_PHYNI|nr:hypothetical protein F443_06797 [Phytophthora nicotianae P1569]ETK89180.1 hypothetical protein L915_06668 [Phytophthora nicotianae]ETO78029.1 hypothetical protein F444_06867 [Phytophthora nicotianae P1976]ETP19037.1 hypothetical protein F441_06801 [Phytophthora nicotianae CJ01A1]ETL42608.1 hypothetical protein L916_06607 [Phytophthora nicotianae]
MVSLSCQPRLDFQDTRVARVRFSSSLVRFILQFKTCSHKYYTAQHSERQRVMTLCVALAAKIIMPATSCKPAFTWCAACPLQRRVLKTSDRTLEYNLKAETWDVYTRGQE